MFDESNDPKLKVLEELIEKMRNLDGQKMKPKAVEVSVSSMKPEMGMDKTDSEGSDDGMDDLGKSDEMKSDADGDDDDLSPEDLAILDKLFADKDQEI